jgi:hypothetical protein
MIFSPGAVTVGNDIFMTDTAYDAVAAHTARGIEIVSHELYHVVQWRSNPLGAAGWYPTYIIAGLLSLPWVLFDWSLHPMEAPAYRFDDAVEKAWAEVLRTFPNPFDELGRLKPGVAQAFQTEMQRSNRAGDWRLPQHR